MELQARVRVWGRPCGRSGARVPRVSMPHFFREDARVGAGSYNLRDELGENSDGVATLRQGLTWVDGDKKTVGFGEKHPTTENAVDGMRSQADRRVEVLLLDAGEEPNLAATNGEDIYDGVTFERTTLEPMKSARPWRAYWEVKIDPTTGEELPARMDDVRKMILEAPGLGAGVGVTWTIEELVDDASAARREPFVTQSDAGHADCAFLDWYAIEHTSREPMRLIPEFPRVSFRFTASSAGRETRSNVLGYRDFLDAVLRLREFATPLPNMPCEVATPWGRKEVLSDANARVVCEYLPPGGCRVLFKARRFS